MKTMITLPNGNKVPAEHFGVPMKEKKLLFKVTLREINYLLEHNYLNEKGIEWARSFYEEEIKAEARIKEEIKGERK